MSTTNAGYGNMAGAVVGSVGGSWGSGVVGAAGGIIGGMFDSAETPWYDENWFNQRADQISKFEISLNQARTRYLASLGNMYNQAYTRFSGNVEAGFASRGLAVNGGAFASALAKKTADYTAELTPTAYSAEREDLNNIANMRQVLFNQKTNAKVSQSNALVAADQAQSSALGGFNMNNILSGKNPYDTSSFGAFFGLPRDKKPKDPVNFTGSNPNNDYYGKLDLNRYKTGSEVTF